MNAMTILVPLVVAIPLIGAAITLALGRRHSRQIAVSVVSLTLVVLAGAVIGRGAIVQPGVEIGEDARVAPEEAISA